MRTFTHSRIALSLVAATLLTTTLAGCASYHVGAHTLYEPSIATVHVPVFESDSLRRHLGERLTEAVVKQIELKTPYKVVSRGSADSVFVGRILSDRKRGLVENSYDEPRQLDVSINVQVSWINTRGQPIRSDAFIPIQGELLQISRNATLVPEVGHSLVTSQQQAIDRLAQQIVAMMEVPW